MDKNYLVHYGVLGMKWGVRTSSQGTTNAKKVASKKSQMDTAKVRLNTAKINKKAASKRSEKKVTKEILKSARKDYWKSKLDYLAERNKENESYSKLDPAKKSMDLFVLGEDGQAYMNRRLNENKKLKVEDVRKSAYIEAGVNFAQAMLSVHNNTPTNYSNSRSNDNGFDDVRDRDERFRNS